MMIPDDGLILAFDIGTSSLRTALFDTRAARIEPSTHRRQYHLATDAGGKAELDPAELLEAAAGCLQATLAFYKSDRDCTHQPVLAVGTSCFWHSLLGVDAAGEPLTPVYTLFDARSARDAAELRERLSEVEIHRRTGCMLRASFWPAKLIWLQRTQPDLFARVRYWLSPAEWLYWKLAGVRACATAMVTATGLFDPTKLDWDEELLQICGIERACLLPVDDAAQAMAAGCRDAYPALADAAWFAGIGDGAAGNLGSGAVAPGLAAINFGTSAAIRVMKRAAEAVSPLGLFAYRVDQQRFLTGGPVSNAGNLHAWCLRELRLPDDPAAIERAMAERREPGHGLQVLPFWNAERAPTWREDMSGCILGLHAATTALDILQAITEAVFHRLAQIAEMIPASDEDLRIIVSGGLNQSPSGLQRLANVLGRPITVCGEPEASIRGAAVDVLERLGRDVAPPPGGHDIAPDPTLAKRYATLRKQQRELEALLYPQAT